MRGAVAAILGAIALPACAAAPASDEHRQLAGFQRSPWFDEQVCVERPADAVRVAILAPIAMDPTRPTRVVCFATPNGNTLEQTLGARRAPGLDWQYDIQHVAAQVRRWREIASEENLVLACLEPTPLSWPAWRRDHGGGGAGIRQIVQRVIDLVPGADRITLSAHSGGGSFLWGYLEDGDAIPDQVDRIVFLDANYSFDAAKGHGDAFLRWLEGPTHHLVVIAYDDREITYEGKRVVGPTGGTYRATQRMFDCLGSELQLTRERRGPFEVTTALDGRFRAYRHDNPDNVILHTRLVGEMNGLLHALTIGTEHEETWGKFGGPRGYDAWIQATPGTGWSEPTGGDREAPSR